MASSHASASRGSACLWAGLIAERLSGAAVDNLELVMPLTARMATVIE